MEIVIPRIRKPEMKEINDIDLFSNVYMEILKEKQDKNSENKLEQEIFYYSIGGPLSKLIEAEFVEKLFSNGRFYAVSTVAIDASPLSFAIIPTGKLIMTVDKNTYEQLGLEGVPSSFYSKHQYFDILIDLFSPNYKPEKKFYARVQWCLKGRIPDVDCYCCYIKDGCCQKIEFPKEFSVQILNLVQSNWTGDHFQVPILESSILDRKQVDLDNCKALFDSETIHTDFLMNMYDWLGLFSCRISDLLETVSEISSESRPNRTSKRTFLCEYECPLRCYYDAICTAIRFQGFLSSDFVLRFFTLARLLTSFLIEFIVILFLNRYLSGRTVFFFSKIGIF